MLNLSLVVGQGLGVFQVADMLTQEERSPFGQGEGRFLFRAAGQHARTILLQEQGLGCVATAAPQEICLPVKDPQQGVVAAGDNVPVMHQEPVGDALQVFHCLAVVIHDRTIGTVCAGHDQCVEPFHEQVVEGGIGKHNA